jgi:hypothetical protein
MMHVKFSTKILPFPLDPEKFKDVMCNFVSDWQKVLKSLPKPLVLVIAEKLLT